MQTTALYWYNFWPFREGQNAKKRGSVITVSDRAYLIEQGILPSPEEAKKTYWSLGTMWWKQLIDGWAHKYGPMVFDEGLYKGSFCEPGYLEGIKAASRFFTDNFDKPFSLDLYKAIHAHACSHFATSKPYEESGVVANSANNSFRTIQESSKYDFSDYQAVPPEMRQFTLLSDMWNKVSDAQADLRNEEVRALIANLSLEVNGYYKKIAAKPPVAVKVLEKKSQSAIQEAKKLLETIAHPSIPDDPDALCSILHIKSMMILPKVQQIAEDYIKRMNRYFEIITFGLSLMEPLVQCAYWTANIFRVIYPPRSAGLQEFISKQIINNFNRNLTCLQKRTCIALRARTPVTQLKQEYQDEACKLIADLFGQLEWAHPWTDGQGRTDLITLNGLLCQEGLHPAILYHPYYSTGCPLDQWLLYLKAGLKKWEQVKEKN